MADAKGANRGGRISYDAQHNEFCAYVLPEDETPYGMSLGNYKTFVSSTPKGGIRGLWDADTDQVIFGTHQIAYRLGDAGRTRFSQQIRRTFTFLPYAQVSEFALDERIFATETFYVPHGPAHERSVALVVEVTLHNRGAVPVDVAVFPWALMVGLRFYGDAEDEVISESVDGHIRTTNAVTGGCRWWGATRDANACVIADREQPLLGALRSGSLDAVAAEQGATVRGRRLYGAFEFRMNVAPGARESLRLAVVYDRRGTVFARPAFDALLRDPRALHETQRYYAMRLSTARFLTPSPQISRGVVWAKCNMLRIVKEYPHGWGSTNSPPSDILVSRDTSWFVHGFDYFMPEFSRDALELFNLNVEDSGQVVEYVRGVSGFRTSYDLNINDDTPLHLIAILHHYNATLDQAWVERLHPLIVKIADYMLSQRDGNGLIWCEAPGEDMRGITSWRNIIPYYTLDGAVTEINAECVFALDSAAMLCAVVGDRVNWERFTAEARSLREAMTRHLYNEETAAFALNWDRFGAFQDNFTADEIFPVLFNVADEEGRHKILARLLEPDFTTPVGLRTISTADPWYFPSHGFGLLGGVWPDLTLWFVVALARNGYVNEAAHWLEVTYAVMEEGGRRNTVPGQFAEWFDGGSLTNRGMYLSPWTGAKYLWAVAETVAGMDGYRTSGRPHLSPLIPAGWLWTAGVKVRWGSGTCTYVIDVARRTIYGDMIEASSEDPYRCIYAGTDISDEVSTSPIEVAAIAFEDEAGRVRIFVCNLNDMARNVSLEFRGATIKCDVAQGGIIEVVPGAPPAEREAIASAPDMHGAPAFAAAR
jgi:glycogen debranching enzyme